MAWLLAFVPIGALLLWGVVAPEHQWRTLAAWRYRDPNAQEPSAAAYTVARIANAVVLVALIGATIGLVTHQPAGTPQAATTPRAAAESPSAAPEGPSPVRLAFDADRADFQGSVTQPGVPPAGARAVPVLHRQAYDENARPPAWLMPFDRPPAGTRLVVSVGPDAAPAAVVAQETAEQVTVTVYTTCAACTSGSPATRVYLVPVKLAQPLGTRPVVDGSTGATIS